MTFVVCVEVTWRMKNSTGFFLIFGDLEVNIWRSSYVIDVTCSVNNSRRLSPIISWLWNQVVYTSYCVIEFTWPMNNVAWLPSIIWSFWREAMMFVLCARNYMANEQVKLVLFNYLIILKGGHDARYFRSKSPGQWTTQTDSLQFGNFEVKI
jgi:hypothetical protein